MIPESFIQDLLNRVDIVDVIDKSVPLKKAGANYSACCPFHNEKSPSFTVSPTKQFYHCFGCGAHGTAISFLMEYAGLSFVESIHDLAKNVGMIVPQVDSTPASREADAANKTIKLGLQETLQQAANYYKAELKKSGRAIEYLKARGLSGVIAAKFQIGYAPAGWQNLQSVFANYENEALQTAGLVVENEQGRRYDRFRDRIMFPIHDQKGQVIGFGGRVINPEDTPKYYNSPETPLFQKGHELYGLFVARRAIRDAGRVLVVEGYMDVVALAQYGIDYAVAALGTATTAFHIKKLKRQTDEIVFCFDGDDAGRKAAWRAAMNALPELTDSFSLRFLFLPKEHDPDSYVREFGKERFETEVTNAKPLSRYIVDYLTIDNGLNYDEDSARFWEEVKPIITDIKTAPILSQKLRKKVADLIGITVPKMLELIDFKEEQKKVINIKVTNRNRESYSIERNFLILIILFPKLVVEEDLKLITGNGIEIKIIREVLNLSLTNPNYKPVAIIEFLKSKYDANYIDQIARNLDSFDEKSDPSLVMNGFRQQLQSIVEKQKFSILSELKEKPFNTLTEQEREMLKSLTVKK